MMRAIDRQRMNMTHERLNDRSHEFLCSTSVSIQGKQRFLGDAAAAMVRSFLALIYILTAAFRRVPI
jgi:hypothetical protein